MKAILILFNGNIKDRDVLTANLFATLMEGTINLLDKPEISVLSDEEVAKYISSGVISAVKKSKANIGKLSTFGRTLNTFCEYVVDNCGTPETDSNFGSSFLTRMVLKPSLEDFHIVKTLCNPLDSETISILHRHRLSALPAICKDLMNTFNNFR